MRQGNDVGTQYRSGIYTFADAQAAAAEQSKAAYQRNSTAAGFGAITTEILPAPEFYFAEDYHQQYLAKVPHGYCGLGGTGVTCAMPTGVSARPELDGSCSARRRVVEIVRRALDNLYVIQKPA